MIWSSHHAALKLHYCSQAAAATSHQNFADETFAWSSPSHSWRNSIFDSTFDRQTRWRRPAVDWESPECTSSSQSPSPADWTTSSTWESHSQYLAANKCRILSWWVRIWAWRDHGFVARHWCIVHNVQLTVDPPLGWTNSRELDLQSSRTELCHNSGCNSARHGRLQSRTSEYHDNWKLVFLLFFFYYLQRESCLQTYSASG